METIMRVRTLLLLAVLGVVVAAIAATTAIAQQGDPQQPSPATVQSAHVNYAAVPAGGGTLPPTQSLGATFALNFAPGQYVVSFDHDVTRCAYVATIGTAGTPGLLPPNGEISTTSASGRAGLPPGTNVASNVYVRTFTSGGAAANRPFFLTVNCRD